MGCNGERIRQLSVVSDFVLRCSREHSARWHMRIQEDKVNCLLGTHPIREGPSEVFEVLVVDEVGGVEADPGANALDDNCADVGGHIAEAVCAHSLQQPCTGQLNSASFACFHRSV